MPQSWIKSLDIPPENLANLLESNLKNERNVIWPLTLLCLREIIPTLTIPRKPKTVNLYSRLHIYVVPGLDHSKFVLIGNSEADRRAERLQQQSSRNRSQNSSENEEYFDEEKH